jgi:hypothetical protein
MKSRSDADLGQRLLSAVNLPTLVIHEADSYSLYARRSFGARWTTLDQVYETLERLS